MSSKHPEPNLGTHSPLDDALLATFRQLGFRFTSGSDLVAFALSLGTMGPEARLAFLVDDDGKVAEACFGPPDACFEEMVDAVWSCLAEHPPNLLLVLVAIDAEDSTSLLGDELDDGLNDAAELFAQSMVIIVAGTRTHLVHTPECNEWWLTSPVDEHTIEESFRRLFGVGLRSPD